MVMPYSKITIRITTKGIANLLPDINNSGERAGSPSYSTMSRKTVTFFFSYYFV